MTKELAKKQKCLVFKSGIRLWLDEDKAEQIASDWKENTVEIFEIGGNVFKGSEIQGIFTPRIIQDLDRIKRGMWICEYGTWHNRNDICYCGRR